MPPCVSPQSRLGMTARRVNAKYLPLSLKNASFRAGFLQHCPGTTQFPILMVPSSKGVYPSGGQIQ